MHLHRSTRGTRLWLFRVESRGRVKLAREGPGPAGARLRRKLAAHDTEEPRRSGRGLPWGARPSVTAALSPSMTTQPTPDPEPGLCPSAPWPNVKEREFNGPALLLGMKGMKFSPVVTGIDFDTHTWTNQSLRKGASGLRAASRCRHGLFWGTVCTAQTTVCGALTPSSLPDLERGIRSDRAVPVQLEIAIPYSSASAINATILPAQYTLFSQYLCADVVMLCPTRALI
jgi:hypothetical protein